MGVRKNVVAYTLFGTRSGKTGMKIVRSCIGLTLLNRKNRRGITVWRFFTPDHGLKLVPWWSDILFFEEHVNHISGKSLAGNASFCPLLAIRFISSYCFNVGDAVVHTAAEIVLVTGLKNHAETTIT